jgi:hypothetical protein
MTRRTPTVTHSRKGINPTGYPVRLVVRKVTFCPSGVSRQADGAGLRNGVELDKLKGVLTNLRP